MQPTTKLQSKPRATTYRARTAQCWTDRGIDGDLESQICEIEASAESLAGAHVAREYGPSDAFIARMAEARGCSVAQARAIFESLTTI